jgi:hypothetical protein
MRAALQVIWLLFTMFRIQRWMSALGLLSLIVACFVPPPEATLGLLIWGFVLLLLAPALGGGLLMRMLSAPRTLLLVPYGRLQILAGMLFSTLLVAGSVTLLISSFPLERIVHVSSALLFARVEAIAVVVLLGSFLCAGSVATATLWMFAIALFPLLLQAQQLGPLLPLIALDAGELAFLCVVLWVAFAAWYLRVRFIRPPDDGSGMKSARVFRVTASRGTAIRAYLTGTPSMRIAILNGLIGTLALCGMWFLMSLVLPSGEEVSTRLAKSIAPALWFLGFGGINGFIVSRRSKNLWLRSGLGRRELFRLCEAQAWRYFVETTAPLFVFLGVAWVIEPSLGSWLATFFPFQLAIGACILYFGLMQVRGWRTAEIALAFVLAVSWIVAMVMALSPSASPVLMPAAAVAALAVAMLLRLAALRRWQGIDWIICRPTRASSQALRAQVN